MKIAGLIAEFNPFHNGHKYLLEKIKEDNPDLIVVCLSSYFTMRGELSLHSPFLKAKYALNQADLIISLPLVKALNSADKFAENAVIELSKAGVTDLYFGSENNDPLLYQKLDELFIANNQKIKEALDKGLSYKEATSSIYNILPNDLLGYAYYKAIKKHKLKINIHLIKRIGSLHGELEPQNSSFASSSAIRNNLDLLKSYSPDYVTKDNLLDFEKAFPYFKYLLLTLNKEDYQNISFISEGIENLLIKNIKKANSFKELIEISATKRYTKSRIRRAIIYIMFKIPKIKDDYPFTRVLGYSLKGKAYLNLYKKEFNLLTNIKEGLNPVLDIELKVAKTLDYIYKTNNLALEQKGPVIKGE